MQYLTPELPILVVSSLLWSFMISRWHFFGPFWVWPAMSVLDTLVDVRSARSAPSVLDRRLMFEFALYPLVGLLDLWDVEPPEWPNRRTLLPVVAAGLLCLYGWRAVGAMTTAQLPGTWLSVAAWWVFAYVYVDSTWPQESTMSHLTSAWKDLWGRRTMRCS